jgi:signal transduction histidine kinase
VTVVLAVDDILAELSTIIEFYNEEDSSSSYGLLIKAEDHPSIHFHPARAPTHVSLAEGAIGQLDAAISNQVFSLPEDGTEPKVLFLWRLPLRTSAPDTVVWCVATDNGSWEPFFPAKLNELGQLCVAYLNSCYSTADPHYLIASAFEAGASRLALTMIRTLAKADSAIIWIYHPQAHYFQAWTILGAASGRYVTGVGKGIVGQLSPANRHITVDINAPGSLQPFHPDLFLNERWTRLQYTAICSEGSLLGAIGLYWRDGNSADYLPESDALGVASLANIMLAAEQAKLTFQEKLDHLEQMIVKLTPAQALINFLHDIQRSLIDVTTAMNGAAVLLDRSQAPERKAIAAQLSRSADFVDGCMNRMARLALLQEKVRNHKRTDLQRLLRGLRPVLTSHSAVEVSIDSGHSQVWIRADRLSVERAILNVVTNAVYWTEAKLQGERRVNVRLYSDDGAAIIDVEDTGLGVGAEVRDHIFEKFVSGRPDTGTGMGLYIVKDILQSHGGDVSFFANRRHGTTFRLAFPLMEAL